MATLGDSFPHEDRLRAQLRRLRTNFGDELFFKVIADVLVSQQDGSSQRLIECGTRADRPYPAPSIGSGVSHVGHESQVSDVHAAPTRTHVSEELKRAAGTLARTSIFECEIGSTLLFGEMTRQTAIDFGRMGLMAKAMSDRLLKEVPWPNDVTTLRKCCPIALAKDIWDNRYKISRKLPHDY